MHAIQTSAPPPDLRIVPIEAVHAHEEHDEQRSKPLIERIRIAEYVTNPPIVAPIGASQYVILDGANRCYTFRYLGYPHLLIQVVTYESGYVDLFTWQHIVSGWNIQALVDELKKLDSIQLIEGRDSSAIMHIIFKDSRVFALRSLLQTSAERNVVMREVVRLYRENAVLYRTAIQEPDEVWLLYPEAIAMVIFPRCTPADVMSAAKYRAFLPPGISRHIIHGRALRVNYPVDILKDRTVKLVEKNEMLQKWLQTKLANRQVRYYAEATYIFDE